MKNSSSGEVAVSAIFVLLRNVIAFPRDRAQVGYIPFLVMGSRTSQIIDRVVCSIKNGSILAVSATGARSMPIR